MEPNSVGLSTIVFYVHQIALLHRVNMPNTQRN
jgi:hypothetical protein